jgi:hypothetical protein
MGDLVAGAMRTLPPGNVSGLKSSAALRQAAWLWQPSGAVVEGFDMWATVICQTCELQARFSSSSSDRDALEFDAVQFRTQCKTSCQSRNYECPDLVKSIKTAAWDTSTEF